MSALQPFTLLPAKPGTCPQCAAFHPPDFPHNQTSLHWQYWFYNEHGRWPTWTDAAWKPTKRSVSSVVKIQL